MIHWEICKPDYLIGTKIEAELNSANLISIEKFARTAIDEEGLPVFSIGLFPHRQGVFDVWLVTTDRMKDHTISIIRDVRAWMVEMVETHGIHRLQAFVDPNFPDGERFVAHYGFEREGLLRAYGANREDFVLFARVFE